MRERSGGKVDQMVAVDAGGTLIDYAFLNRLKWLSRRARLAAAATLVVVGLFALLDTIVEQPVRLLNRFATLFRLCGESRGAERLSVLSRDLSLPLNPCVVRDV